MKTLIAIFVLILLAQNSNAEIIKGLFGFKLGNKHMSDMIVSPDEIKNINSTEALEEIFVSLVTNSYFESVEPTKRNNDYNKYYIGITPISGTIWMIQGYGKILILEECSLRKKFYINFFKEKYKDHYIINDLSPYTDDDSLELKLMRKKIENRSHKREININFICENQSRILNESVIYATNSHYDDLYRQEVATLNKLLLIRKEEIELSKSKADDSGL